MATFSKRGDGWFAQVRRKGYPHEHKTFSFRRDAVAWARGKEAELDAIAPARNPNAARQSSLGDLVRRYVAEVTRSADGTACCNRTAEVRGSIPLSSTSAG